MARYIPQTYSNRLSAELQKQANDLVPVLEKAGSLEECYSLVQQFTAQTKATAYIEDDYGDILYSSDKLTITTDKDSIATIQENPDSKYALPNFSKLLDKRILINSWNQK